MVNIQKTEKFDHELEEESEDVPKVFGDLVTSDSVFAIKRSSTSPAKAHGTTALVIRDKATG